VAEGKAVAYASEAGTPLVSDPGFVLARAAVAEGVAVRAAPGPSAVLAALAVAGLPTDRFLFAGFAPAATAARRRFLDGLRDVQATLVLYESPKRIAALLEDAAEVLGADRPAAVCRELTKRFEEVERGTLGTLSGRPQAERGEYVLCIDRAAETGTDAATWQEALDRAMTTLSVKDAAAMVAEAYGLPRRDVYQVALQKGR
jgi:16S rRNA (cytidine1402-2'-O)-methyltransferase